MALRLRSGQAWGVETLLRKIFHTSGSVVIIAEIWTGAGLQAKSSMFERRRSE